QVEPGVFANDDGALAAHFAGDDAIVMCRGKFLDAVADVVAAGKEDNVDSGMLDKSLAGWAFAVHEVDRPRWKACFFKEFDDALTDGRRIFGWLEDDRISLQQTRSQHPD